MNINDLHSLCFVEWLYRLRVTSPVYDALRHDLVNRIDLCLRKKDLHAFDVLHEMRGLSCPKERDERS